MSVFCLLICLWLCIHSSDAAIKDYYWRDYSFGEMPSDAVEIANDGKYIGQALVTKAIIPVTIYPHLGMAIGAGFERITIRQNIKILCTSDLNGLYWDLVDFNNPIDGQSKNAIIGGFHMEGLNYYIGKAYLDGEWRVGTNCFQNFYWRNYCHGEIPYDALEVSSGLYVGQIHTKVGNIPAAIYPFRKSAVAVYNSRVNVKEHVKILCTPEPEKFYWEPVNFDKVNMTVMKDAVVGGFQEELSLIYYIGLVNYLDSWKVGKVLDVEVTGWQGVYVWANDGTRVILKEFQLLKYNYSSNDNYRLKYK